MHHPGGQEGENDILFLDSKPTAAEKAADCSMPADAFQEDISEEMLVSDRGHACYRSLQSISSSLSICDTSQIQPAKLTIVSVALLCCMPSVARRFSLWARCCHVSSLFPVDLSLSTVRRSLGYWGWHVLSHR